MLLFRGIVTILATASDNVGVTSVSIYVDGVLKANDAVSPYSISLDTSVLANGSHSIYAKAYDAAREISVRLRPYLLLWRIMPLFLRQPLHPLRTPNPTPTPTPTPTPITTPTPTSTLGEPFEITSISVGTITDTTANITVTTHLPASIVISYGKTTAYGLGTPTSPFLSTNYIKLTGLTPNTVYDFIVKRDTTTWKSDQFTKLYIPYRGKPG